MTCNFNRPVNGKPALFTHDEVITLFHEFGHGLHHMLTRIETAGVSGISGVPWDAVELPSQFMENWCWEPEALAFISGHYETGEPLPKELLDKMLAAKNYCAALFILRRTGVRPVRFPPPCRVPPGSGCENPRNSGRNQETGCRSTVSIHRAVSRTLSAIFSPVVMPQVTTATCGLTYWRQMPSRALRKRAFSTVKPGSRSSTTF